MDDKKLLRRSYQKKFDNFKTAIIDMPKQGWIKTIREFLGMTTTQLAKRLDISQPRVIKMENNENNLKISTLEKIADAMGCDLVYTFVPRKNINDILNEQAKKKAQKILNKVNLNMSLENQLSTSEELAQDIVDDLLNNNVSKIWDDEE